MSIQDSAAPAAAPPSQQHDIVRGAKEIARAVGLPQRSIEHMLARGYLKTPRRIGHAWFASRSRLLKEIAGD